MANVLPRIEPPECPFCEGPCVEPFHRGYWRIPDRLPRPDAMHGPPEPPPPSPRGKRKNARSRRKAEDRARKLGEDRSR